MLESRFIKRRLAVASLFAVLATTVPAVSQECIPAANPYVFILFDTSGSMSYSPSCTQAQIDAGQCSFLCPTGNCYVPLQGDDPASRFVQMKEALYTALEDEFNLQLGFASYNLDALRVPSKHWLYQAQNGGPTISGWGAYPAAGAQEVFGALWGCDTGSGDNEVGCYATTPADLPDAWELTRVRRLSKGGASFTQPQVFFLRRGSAIYKTTYTPASLSAPGDPTLSVNVRIDRCTNSSCTTISPVGQQTVTWGLVDEFLSWDNGSTTLLNRTNPKLQYFTSAANDAVSTNLCNNWEPNTDSAADPFNGYNLRWPTVADPRGPLFDQGDMLPLDWLYDHRQDVQLRLAPNLATGALTPDFRVSTYFQDLPQGGEPFLRLKHEGARPLIALGSTPLGHSTHGFRLWYEAWEPIAAANDPEWACRGKYLLVITENPSVCPGANPCSDVASLRAEYGVETYVVSFGSQIPANQPLPCMAQNGGTGSPYYPQTKQELIDTLNAIFAAVVTP
jgi:hypothetical protein